MTLNPLALVLLAICALVGLLIGSWVIGLLVGLVLVLVASLSTVHRQ